MTHSLPCVIAYFNHLPGQIAPGRALHANLHRERMVDHHGRRDIPNGHAGRMWRRHEANRNAAFVVDDGFRLVPWENDGPDVIARLCGCFEEQFVRFVRRSSTRGQYAGNDGLFAGKDVDRSTTQVAASRTQDPDFQDNLRANLEFGWHGLKHLDRR